MIIDEEKVETPKTSEEETKEETIEETETE